MPFMEFLRGKVIMTVAEAYTEKEIRTPVSKTEELAMLIHQIQVKMTAPPPVDAAIRETTMHIADRTSNVILELDDPSSLFWHVCFVNFGTVEGTLSEAMVYWVPEVIRVNYNPPILYARDSIYLAVDSNHTTALPQVTCQIGYTLERVSSADFIAALVG